MLGLGLSSCFRCCCCRCCCTRLPLTITCFQLTPHTIVHNPQTLEPNQTKPPVKRHDSLRSSASLVERAVHGLKGNEVTNLLVQQQSGSNWQEHAGDPSLRKSAASRSSRGPSATRRRTLKSGFKSSGKKSAKSGNSSGKHGRKQKSQHSPQGFGGGGGGGDGGGGDGHELELFARPHSPLFRPHQHLRRSFSSLAAAAFALSDSAAANIDPSQLVSIYNTCSSLLLSLGQHGLWRSFCSGHDAPNS